MKNKKQQWIKNKILSTLFCIYMLLSLCSCTNMGVINVKEMDKSQTTDASETEAPKYEIDYSAHSFAVHYIDVGQGDAALVVCDDKTMLIDGGKPSASRIIYTYLKNLNIDYLDYIVASHADDDHIGGLSAPLEKMKVKNVLAPETEADTRSYQSFKSKTEAQGLTIQHPKPGDSMDFGSSRIEFYGPITEDENGRNNGSIVMKIIFGDTSSLFTGDAEREEEKEILNAGYNATTYPFLREIMPQYAVISVGDNSYGHPTEDTLSCLRDADVKVYRTDMQGDIVFRSDGKTVTVTTKKNTDAETNAAIAEKNSLSY